MEFLLILHKTTTAFSISPLYLHLHQDSPYHRSGAYPLSSHQYPIIAQVHCIECPVYCSMMAEQIGGSLSQDSPSALSNVLSRYETVPEVIIIETVKGARSATRDQTVVLSSQSSRQHQLNAKLASSIYFNQESFLICYFAYLGGVSRRESKNYSHAPLLIWCTILLHYWAVIASNSQAALCVRKIQYLVSSNFNLAGLG